MSSGAVMRGSKSASLIGAVRMESGLIFEADIISN